MMIKKQKSWAQTSIEFPVLLALVMSAVIIMGPYVVRSWNAYLKGMDDSIKDSFNDPLYEAPDVVALPPCECDTPIDVGCGLNGCASGEMSVYTFCNYGLGCIDVLGVDPFSCVPDPACCTDTPTGNCGLDAINVTGVRVDGQPGCPNGQMENLRTCGGGIPPYYVCLDDPACIFICMAQPPLGDYHYLAMCPLDATGLLANTDTVYVVQGGCSGPDGSEPKCQYECANPFVPMLGGTICDCPENHVEIRGGITCPVGYIGVHDDGCL